MKRFIPFLSLGTVLLLIVGCDSNSVAPPVETGPALIYYNLDGKPQPSLLRVAPDGSGETVLVRNCLLDYAPRSGRMLLTLLDTASAFSWFVMAGTDGTILDTVPTMHGPELAVLSPNARKICYGYTEWNVGVRPATMLRLIDDDGKNDLLVTSEAEWNSSASFSPDGNALAFYTEGALHQSRLYAIDTDGGNRRLLSERATPAADGHLGPCWFPSGDRLLYIRQDSADATRHAIWSIRTDGTGAMNLTADIASATMPHISPDGTTIAFSTSAPDGTEGDIWLMNADGTNKRKLTDTPGSSEIEILPQWSPDGTKILCLNIERPGVTGDSFGRLEVIEVADGGVQFLTDTHQVFRAWWSR